MKILITGGKGMLGRTLVEKLSAHELLPVDIGDMDVTDACRVDDVISRFKPERVIHCAAMTDVDLAETQSDLAMRVNAIGSANVASACFRHGAKIIAFSTDYVFSGTLDRPYHEWDETAPATRYGFSKAAGEQAIRQLCPDHLILRISWLYGPGGPSFLHSMVRLGKGKGPPLPVVDDQYGCPTSAFAVADVVNLLLDKPIAGTLHTVCEGEATWYQFAQEIFRLWGMDRAIIPCSTEDFPRSAPRPKNSRLRNYSLQLHNLAVMPHWREALDEFHKSFFAKC